MIIKFYCPRETAQQVEALAANLDDLRSVPRIHIAEGHDSYRLSYDLHANSDCVSI